MNDGTALVLWSLAVGFTVGDTDVSVGARRKRAGDHDLGVGETDRAQRERAGNTAGEKGSVGGNLPL